MAPGLASGGGEAAGPHAAHTRLAATGHIVFRCDGNELIGAGHVGRCVPLAIAFVELNWRVSFVGTYEGVAGQLLARAKVNVRPPCPHAPCGVADKCDAVVLDSYLIAPAAICELVRALPVVTVAEANRCPKRGILLDYHLDRTEPSTDRLLAGPSFAPLDPAFAGAGRSGEEIRRVLITLGGSRNARELLAQIASAVSSALPDADILLIGDAKSETHGPQSPRISCLPSAALVDVVSGIDLAVTAAGLTAYELACAGIPQVTIATAANQRRVVEGLRHSRLAPCLDLTSGDSLADLSIELERLCDAGLRRGLSEQGRKVFDGQGARRAAVALIELHASGKGSFRRPVVET